MKLSFLALLLLIPGDATAATHVVCLLGDANTDALRDALLIEARQATVSVDVVGTRCPSDSVAVTFAGPRQVRVIDAFGAGHTLDVTHPTELGRATEIARWALTVVTTTREPPLALAPSLPVPVSTLNASPPPVSAEPAGGTARLLVAVGMTWGFEAQASSSRWGLELSLAVPLFDGRLELGLLGGWRPSRRLSSDPFDAHVEGGHVAALARLRVGDGALSAGIGLAGGASLSMVDVSGAGDSSGGLDAHGIARRRRRAVATVRAAIRPA